MKVIDKPLRVVLIGPECTGKTRLAQALASCFHVPWSAEFARLFVESRQHAVQYGDVDTIGRGQVDEEERAIALAGARRVPFLLHDTDLISTLIYSRHYFGTAPAWIEPASRNPLADLYLLHHPDVPWTADPAQREQPERGEELFSQFRETLREFGASIAPIFGTWEARRTLALDALREILGIASPPQSLQPGKETSNRCTDF